MRLAGVSEHLIGCGTMPRLAVSFTETDLQSHFRRRMGLILLAAWVFASGVPAGTQQTKASMTIEEVLKQLDH